MLFLGGVLCENALRTPAWMRKQTPAESAQGMAALRDSKWESAEIKAADGAILRSWWFQPREANGDAVILLHGVGDDRGGVLAYAALLLKNHYAVLTPDSRGHGASGGDVITFGIKEKDDVKRWTDWIASNKRPRRLYGLGESMGAAILLQSLNGERRFQSVVAECPFSTFRAIAYDRLETVTGLRSTPLRFLLVGLVEPAFLYARVRYGVDLRGASPIEALRATSTPVLLIHGLNDDNIPPRHSRILKASNPAAELWEVKGAYHTCALSANPKEFERRVIGWFQGRP
jgi:fermentation-respiration switch protein FrsA (DUF1100 family)